MVWIDMEMTGLEPQTDTILEVAIIITDIDLNPIDKGENIVIHHSEDTLKKMDEWNLTTHTHTGLYRYVLESNISIQSAEKSLLKYVKKHITEKTAPVCGNTVWQDRMFLANYMPKFNNYMHYRNIDVSTLKELSFKWYPNLPKFQKIERHSALQDIKESLSELKYYRDNILKAPIK
ncbi:MAG: oligoribonuclease [SAR324 cluster bacterium]|nr:oligoribonuclease [SAR324 cluster bacterium]